MDRFLAQRWDPTQPLRDFFAPRRGFLPVGSSSRTVSRRPRTRFCDACATRSGGTPSIPTMVGAGRWVERRNAFVDTRRGRDFFAVFVEQRQLQRAITVRL